MIFGKKYFFYTFVSNSFPMKKSIFTLIFICAAFSFAAVSCKDDCEKDATGTLVIQNQSATNTTYNVVVDGSSEGSVNPGNEESFDLPSGAHSVQILNASDNTEACTTTSVSIVECEKSILSCNF